MTRSRPILTFIRAGMVVPRSIGDQKVVLAWHPVACTPLNTIPHGVHDPLRVKCLLCRARLPTVTAFPGALIFNQIEGKGTALRNAISS